MKRTTIIPLLLVIVSTWASSLVLVVTARGIVPEIVTMHENIGAQLPRFSQFFVSFWFTSLVYVVPALASVVLVLVEIFVKSERSRLVIQIVYTAGWVVFLTLNFGVLLLLCWRMLEPIGG
jgi:hypothetical protein